MIHHPRTPAADDEAERAHRAKSAAALLRWYPRAWRERYGDELVELLGRERPSPRLTFDLLRGALDAHLHPQLGGGRVSRSRRALGIALLAAFLLAVGIAGEPPLAARTAVALSVAWQSSTTLATPTPAEHGYRQPGGRQE